MGQLQIRRLAYALGAEVTGIDLRDNLDDDTIAAIRRAWLEHILLYFPDQPLHQNEVLAFTKRFGDAELVSTDNSNVDDSPYIALVSEKTINGKPWSGYKAGLDWHSDQSYNTRPSRAVLLHCKEIPPVGGDTMLNNLYMAYETLTPTMRGIVDGLSFVHERGLSRQYSGGNQTAQSGHVVRIAAKLTAAKTPVVHPAALVHPETGRKALYVGPRARRILGMTQEESKPILDFLNQHATRYEFTYRHRWKVNDLLMWDNRCALHIALSDYDLENDPRLMVHCGVSGPESGYRYEADDAAVNSAVLAPT